MIFNITDRGDLKATAQAILEMARLARSAENAADSLLPLVVDKEVKRKLADIKAWSSLTALSAKDIYKKVALEAFGDAWVSEAGDANEA